ncbi:hypothetical protein PhCBS80983_g05307 [Powellomyces hirtus]|uniref:Uncharacterized protein n=1 Tax=Powellomyces hirtus TaxID=109895 RepID=A0A507DUM2_9FUNG|nr:hypothetical protein PhCBS80983_g05307 [Powellomyces hirtus]
MDLLNLIPSVLRDVELKPIVSILLYFSALTVCLTICLSRALKALPYSASAWVYTPLAVGSFYVTWTEIVAFLYGDYKDFISGFPTNSPLEDGLLDEYLKTSDWFDAAYVAVTYDKFGWWWSSQLLNMAAVIVALFWSEGAHHWYRRGDRRGGPTFWMAGMASAVAFVLVGFLGAMSTSFALFLAQRQALDRTYSFRSVPNVTITVVLLFVFYCAAVTYTPYIPADSAMFGINLLLLHIALALPVVGAAGFGLVYHPKDKPSNSAAESRFSMRWLYKLLALGNLFSYLAATSRLDFNRSVLLDLFNAMFLNNCQKSITADLVFCTVIAHVFIVSSLVSLSKRSIIPIYKALTVGALALVATPAVGISVVFPTFLAWREKYIRPRSSHEKLQ